MVSEERRLRSIGKSWRNTGPDQTQLYYGLEYALNLYREGWTVYLANTINGLMVAVQL